MNIPKKLKDPKYYKEIEEKLHIPSDHTHRKISAWQKCKACQALAQERSRIMREIGFKNAQEYFTWKKIMSQVLLVRELQNEKATSKSSKTSKKAN